LSTVPAPYATALLPTIARHQPLDVIANLVGNALAFRNGGGYADLGLQLFLCGGLRVVV